MLISCLIQIIYLSLHRDNLKFKMRRSIVVEDRRRLVNPEILESVDLSFQIVDRIHEILTIDTKALVIEECSVVSRFSYDTFEE